MAGRGGGGRGGDMDNSIFQVNVDFAYKYLSLLAYALTHRESDRQTDRQRDRQAGRETNRRLRQRQRQTGRETI